MTRALKLKNRDQALTAASAIVSDWDGGTRIGDALQAFLAVPRFAGYARGRVVLVLSDGLERGDRPRMRDAVARLSRRAWRLSGSPARHRPGFPQTEALKAVLPSSTISLTQPRSTPSARTSSPSGRRQRHDAIVDAHHHVWRQAELPWLVGTDAAAYFRPV